MAAAIYIGVYRDEQAQPQATIRLVCASQSLPEGVQEMVSAAKREGGQLRDKLQQTLTGLDLGEIEEYELLRTSPGSVRRPRIPEQPSRLGARPLGAAAAVARGPNARAATQHRDAAGASMPPPGGGTADRETYDQMVSEYKSSSSDDVQKRVLDRLESDRRSDNSLVRYYAVRAMTKLDPSLFTDALQAATQDEDATVRAIAAKALAAARLIERRRAGASFAHCYFASSSPNNVMSAAEHDQHETDRRRRTTASRARSSASRWR